MKQQARWIKCHERSGISAYEHDMRDHCWTCAPFWEDVPTCPTCDKKLSPKGFCKTCRKYFNLGPTSWGQ